MAKPNYAFAKRQRDLAKKKKKEEKRRQKQQAVNGQTEDEQAQTVDQPSTGAEPGSD